VRVLPNLSFRQVKPLEVVSHCKVGLKRLIAAVELLFQCGTENNRDIREVFGNTQVDCVSPAVAIFKVDFRFVVRTNRPIVRKDESGREGQLKITLRRDIMFLGDRMVVFCCLCRRGPMLDRSGHKRTAT
jgi:hypothetical protein